MRRRKDARVRRDEILRASADLIDQAGAAVLRFTDVAHALGVSASLVVYHFRTKDALIAETFIWAAQQDLDRLATMTGGVLSARERLVAALAWYAPTGAAKGWRLWIENWAAGLREPALREVGRELDLAWKDSLGQIIESGVTAGEFRTSDARAAAWRITAFLDGLAVQAIVHEGSVSTASVEEQIRRMVAEEVGVDATLLVGDAPSAHDAAAGLPIKGVRPVGGRAGQAGSDGSTCLARASAPDTRSWKS